MSDRIGIMRAGELVQVGAPDEIYSQPANRFVSEFMGEVNVLEVKRDACGLHCPSLDATFTGPDANGANANGHDGGYLVIRPEYLRFLAPGEIADNQVEGVLYNEYALGSRIQYQIRVGSQVFLVEKLREQRYDGKLDDTVTIGWDARDSMLAPE